MSPLCAAESKNLCVKVADNTPAKHLPVDLTFINHTTFIFINILCAD
jgi:hypothetical protein